MFRILDRYIFREIAQTWLAVTVVLLAILLTNQFARVLSEVAKDNLPRDAVFQVIGLTALQYLTVLVPIGLFLSIMLALGRLYQDSEMPAMMACRVGPGGVYRPLSFLLLPLLIGVGWLSVDIAPDARLAIERIGLEARRQADLASIEPGRFMSDNAAGAVVYAETVLGPGTVENVFLQRRDDSGDVQVVVAARGEQRDSDDPNTRYFVLRDGKRYEGIPGTSQFQVMEFLEHGIPYQLPRVEEPELDPDAMPTRDLIASSAPEHVAEFHFRLGVPLSTLILAIIAVPLSRTQPRQGRYGRLAVGLLVIIIYFNLMTAGQAWVEKGLVPGSIGLWWVHALMLLFAVFLLGAQNRIFRRLLRLGRRA